MRHRFVAEALARIDATGGVRGVNLRELARALGCAHTNAYNYFESLDELLWHALVAAVEQLIAHTEAAMARRGGRTLSTFIGSQVDFALAHPGWYRLVWLEVLPGAPPAELLPLLRRPPALFAEILAGLAPMRLTRRQADDAAELVHTYLHGALCKAVAGRAGRAGRAGAPDRGALRRRVTRDAGRLLELASREESAP